MPNATKIATCCYCGTKSALQLRGKVQHELSCSTCGAPLHMMKKLVSATERDDSRIKSKKPVSHRPAPKQFDKPKKSKKPKKRKSTWRWLASEAWDAIEDVFD